MYGNHTGSILLQYIHLRRSILPHSLEAAAVPDPSSLLQVYEAEHIEPIQPCRTASRFDTVKIRLTSFPEIKTSARPCVRTLQRQGLQEREIDQTLRSITLIISSGYR